MCPHALLSCRKDGSQLRRRRSVRELDWVRDWAGGSAGTSIERRRRPERAQAREHSHLETSGALAWGSPPCALSAPHASSRALAGPYFAEGAGDRAGRVFAPPLVVPLFCALIRVALRSGPGIADLRCIKVRRRPAVA